MRRECRLRGRLANKSRAKGYCRHRKMSRSRLQKSKQKRLGAGFMRFAGEVRTTALHHHSSLHGFLHRVSDIVHDTVGHDDEGTDDVQLAVLAVTVHSIMEAAFE